MFKDTTRTKTTNHKTWKSVHKALVVIDENEYFWDRVVTEKTETGYRIIRYKYETKR